LYYEYHNSTIHVDYVSSIDITESNSYIFYNAISFIGYAYLDIIHYETIGIDIPLYYNFSLIPNPYIFPEIIPD